MTPERVEAPSIPDRSTVLRTLLYGFLVLFTSNVGAVVDSVLHPGIPYFDHEHMIVGGITAIVTIVLLGVLDAYMARHRRIEVALHQKEQALRSSEKRFRDLLEGIDLAGVMLDREGNVAFCNRFLLDLTGWSLEEVLHKSWFALFLPEEVRDDIRNAFSGNLGEEEDSRASEYPIVTRGGERRLVSWSNATLRDARGEVIGTASIGDDITERRHSEQVRAATYRISEAAQTASSLDALLSDIHTIVGELMPARNFYIALYDTVSDTLSFPYFVDEHDPQPAPRRPGKGLTEYVLRTGRSALVTPEVRERLERQGEVELIGTPSIDWVGVPLVSDGTTCGVLVLQTYAEGGRYGEAEKGVLEFVSAHIAMILTRKRAEAALGASEERFRTLVEEAGDGFALLGAEGRYLDVNSACCRQLGYPREELLRLRVPDVDPLFGPQQFAADFQRLVGRPPVTYESVHRRKDGTTFPVEVTLSIVQIGGVPQALSLARDITERKQALKALRESEERYRQLFDGITDAVFVHGISDDGMPAEFLAVNDVACERLGYTREELLRLTVRDIDAPESTVDVRAIGLRLRRGEAVLFEQTHVAKDGRRIPVEVHVQSFVLRGRIVVLSVVRDITERKQALQALRESEAKYRSLFDNAEVGMFRTRLDGSEILDVNEKLLTILGRTREEVVGSPSVIHWADLREREELVRQLEADGRVTGFEWRMLTKRGEVKTCLTSARLFREQGILEGSVLDITERKRSEEALRALARHLHAVREEEHTRMAREIHDELGQALTALRLDLTWIGRKLPRASTALRRRIDGAVALTDEAITVGQRIAGELRPPILDDLGLVPAVEWYAQRFATRSGLHIQLDVGAQEPVVPDHLAVTAYRIVQEALTNVARHAQATHVKVRLGGQDGALVIEIRDDGQGIRTDAVNSPRSLGIVGMRERAASLGGTVLFTTSPGAGTTVRVTFPLERRKERRTPQ